MGNNIKKFDEFVNEGNNKGHFVKIKPDGELSDWWYKITHPFMDFSESGLGTSKLVNKKMRKDHEEKFKNEPSPIGTNAADCVGTLDYLKCPISDKISNEIIFKLKSDIYNIENIEDNKLGGILFKLKELPNLWLVSNSPTDCDEIFELEKDGKMIECTSTCGDGGDKIIELFLYIRNFL